LFSPTPNPPSASASLQLIFARSTHHKPLPASFPFSAVRFSRSRAFIRAAVFSVFSASQSWFPNPQVPSPRRSPASACPPHPGPSSPGPADTPAVRVAFNVTVVYCGPRSRTSSFAVECAHRNLEAYKFAKSLPLQSIVKRPAVVSPRMLQQHHPIHVRRVSRRVSLETTFICVSTITPF